MQPCKLHRVFLYAGITRYYVLPFVGTERGTLTILVVQFAHKTHLSLHADIHKDAAIFIPTADAFQISGAAFVVDDKGSNTISETFFEHEKSANAAVTIFKWADTFELHMEIQNLVKADIFLRFVLFDQGGHGCPDL